MKVTRIAPTVHEADPQLALGLIGAIGLDSFATRMLEAVETALPSSHCTVFGLRGNGRMEAVSIASAIGESAPLAAVDYLRLGYDRLDTNTLWLRRKRPTIHRQFWIGHQLASDVSDRRYRRICYDEPGIRERLSLLSVFPDGYRVSISFYRNFSYRDYTRGDMDWLALQAPLLAATVMQHVRVFPRASAQKATESDLLTTLSGREREIISHISEGLTTKQAAVEMGISPTTAATYRYRAFRHLGVRTTVELFAALRTR